MGVSAKIASSMLSSNLANLASEAQCVLDCGTDWLHMDIMDGHYVPNLTIGAPVIKSLRKHTKAYIWIATFWSPIHLITSNRLVKQVLLVLHFMLKYQKVLLMHHSYLPLITNLLAKIVVDVLLASFSCL